MNNQFFNQNEKDAVYRVIRERRDVRCFKSDPIPEETLRRILSAAMQAPSVGYMQPSNFILIDNQEIRQRIHTSFLKANEEAKALFPGERGDKYASLKLEGILECALNICVTCDRERFGTVGL
ncbi:MAG TPA: nitroreductase family protein, partial [bacterium]|nr:nitroreductase family protein [bacterium]